MTSLVILSGKSSLMQEMARPQSTTVGPVGSPGGGRDLPLQLLPDAPWPQPASRRNIYKHLGGQGEDPQTLGRRWCIHPLWSCPSGGKGLANTPTPKHTLDHVPCAPLGHGARVGVGGWVEDAACGTGVNRGTLATWSAPGDPITAHQQDGQHSCAQRGPQS